jgi:glucan-binding YG repeat protein
MSNKWKLIIAVIAFGGLVNMCSSQNTTETTPKPTATLTTVENTATKQPTSTKIPTRTKRAIRPTYTAQPSVISQKTIDDAKPCNVGQIKGNPNGANGNKIYHKPTWRYYAKTKNASVQCFNTVEEAVAAGYRASEVK